MLLSFIIPAYNVAQYILDCVESCENQDLEKSDFELIIINDGSKDNSLEIALNLQGKYSNITVVSQENSGLSMARNKGLEYAHGEYIWFVDSDDIIKENCLRSIIERCHRDDLDLLGICAANIDNNELRRRFDYIGRDGVYKGTDVLNEGSIQCCSPFTIYRRSFLVKNNLRFFPGIYHEDNEFSPRVYYLAERVGFLNDVLYYVRQTPGSITRTPNPKRAYDYVTVCDSLHHFYYNQAKENNSVFFHNQISYLINNALFLAKDNKVSINDIMYENKHLFIHMKESKVLKYRIEGLLFSCFSKHVQQIFSIMTKVART